MQRLLALTLASFMGLSQGCAALSWKDKSAQADDPLRGDQVASHGEPKGENAKAKLKAPQADDEPLRPAATLATNAERKTAPAAMPTALPTSPAALTVAQPKPLNVDDALAIDRGTKNGGRSVEQAQWAPARPTWEQLQETLQAKGITEYQLEEVNGAWHFSCFVPNPENPKIKRCYEGESTVKVDAVLGVLKKLEARK